MIVVAGDIFINEGTKARGGAWRAQAIADMMNAHVAHGTQQEAGCIRYNFYADLEDEHHFIVYEEWESQEHLNVHLSSDKSLPAPHFIVYAHGSSNAHLSSDNPPAHMAAFRKASEGVRKSSNVKFMTASVNA